MRVSATALAHFTKVPKPAKLLVSLFIIFLCLIALFGTVKVSQATINGFITGSYLGLGAMGLTLIMGVMKLVNFAYGDFLVAGAYLTLMFTALGTPLPLSVLLATLGTALLSLVAEKLVWRPLRNAGASTLQCFLSAMGLSFLIRFTIQFFGGSESRSFDIDVLSTMVLGPFRVGTQQALGFVMALAALSMLAIGLRISGTMKTMRAVSDNRLLAEVCGIGVGHTIDVTSLLSGLLAGVAGIVYATAVGSFNPNFGVTLLLSLFAATTLGGIGNIYGAMLGGLVIGLSQEWSTLLLGAKWKTLVALVFLVIMLLAVPRGIFARAQRRP